MSRSSRLESGFQDRLIDILKRRFPGCMVFKMDQQQGIPDILIKHAFLGASKYHWVNYDESKVAEAYAKFKAVQRGTELHEFAAQCIRLGIKLPKSQKTLNMYVNDAIGFKMTPEQVLYYSDNCFGTADATAFA